MKSMRMLGVEQLLRNKAPNDRSAIGAGLCEDLLEKLVQDMGLMRREATQKQVLMGQALHRFKLIGSSGHCAGKLPLRFELC